MIKKKISLVILLLVTSLSLLAQSNSFPTAGDVSIFNYSPLLVLQRNTDEGGFIQGIQTRFKNGTNNWYFGNLHSDSWIVSKGDYQNPKFTISQNGNVGIGTSSPGALLDIHTKISQAIAYDSQNWSTSNLGFGLKLQTVWDINQGIYQHFIQKFNGVEYASLSFFQGRVGIGATIPRQKLEVVGLGAFSSSPSASSLIIDGSALPTSNNYSNVRLIAGGNRESGFLKSKLDNWSGYFSWVRGGSSSEVEVMRIDTFTGNVGIGTTNPTSKLTVAGNINSREVKVSVDAGADFVFEKDYALPSLQEVEKFVNENKHLPEIASAKEMQKEGINLSEMNIKLLQKIEELTLYMIEQNNQLKLQSDKIQKQNQEFEILKTKIKKLESKQQ